MKIEFKTFCYFLGAVFLFSALVGSACSEKKPVECVDPPESKNKQQKTTRTLRGDPLPKPDPNADWCRTCVMGPKGWASCQIAFAEKMGEDRAQIKERSRQRACLDSGFKKGECPDSAVKAVTCKDDPPPKGVENPSETLQKIFFNRNQDKGGTDKPAESGDGSSQNSQ